MIVKRVDFRGIIIDAQFPDGSSAQFLSDCTPDQLLQLSAHIIIGVTEVHRRVAKANSALETLVGEDDEL